MWKLREWSHLECANKREDVNGNEEAIHVVISKWTQEDVTLG